MRIGDFLPDHCIYDSALAAHRVRKILIMAYVLRCEIKKLSKMSLESGEQETKPHFRLNEIRDHIVRLSPIIPSSEDES